MTMQPTPAAGAAITGRHGLWASSPSSVVRRAATMTPHVAAVTRPDEAIAYIARTIGQVERGEKANGLVDRTRGY